MRCAVLAVIVALCGCAVGRAQDPLDDVYNWREPKSAADPGAVKKWPPFYKPPPISLEHQIKYAMGWCRVHLPQNFPDAPSYTINPKDIIDVNKLPEIGFNGKIVSNRGGQLLVSNEAREAFHVIIYPDPQVSQVAVAGEALPQALKTGVYVRFSGKIDRSGAASEVSELELVCQPAEAPPPNIRVDERQMIVARVASRKGDRLSLRSKSEGFPRLTLDLSGAERIGLRARDPFLAAAGDAIIVKGRLYRPLSAADSLGPGGALFASEVQIKLSQPVANVAKGGRRKIATKDHTTKDKI